MKNLLSHWLLAGFFLVGLVLFSSYGMATVTVQSVTLNNPPATSCTNTELTVTGQLGAANYQFSANNISVSGQTITVDVEYTSGPIVLPAITPFTQVVNLGLLAPGTYTINVNGVLNGNTNSTQTITVVVVSCCPAIPSFTVSDTAECEGATISFTNNSTGATSQFWKDNGVVFSTAVSPTLVLAGQTPHTIELVVTDGTCSDSTSQTITTYPDPPVNLGNDTSICSGTPLMLNAGPGTSYLWSDNSTGQTLSVNAVGSYSVTVTTANGCSASDAVSILSVDPSPMVNLGSDTLVCDGDSLLLDAGSGFTSVQWSDNSTNSTLLAGPGPWAVTVTDGNCSTQEMINIGAYAPVVVDLGPDTTACGNYQLDAGGGFVDYAWSDMGSLSQANNAIASGTYTVTVTDNNGCTGTSSTNLTILEVPAVELGNDTQICEGQIYTLESGVTNTTNFWQDGSGGTSIQVALSGQYWIQATGANGCVASDTINIDFIVCSGVEEWLQTTKIGAYPNPTTGVVVLDQLTGDRGTLHVLDVHGRLVYTEQIGPGQQWVTDLSSLSQGMYVL